MIEEVKVKNKSGKIVTDKWKDSTYTASTG